MDPNTSQNRLRVFMPALPAALIGIAIVLAAIIGSYTFYAVRSLDNTLSVTGSAKTEVTADSVKWTINISRQTTEYSMQGGYAQLADDLASVKTFLKMGKIADSAIIISQVYVDEMYKYDPSTSGGPRQFTLRQTVTVNSNDVNGIDGLSKNINQAAGKSVFITGNSLEFYVTKLPQLRVSLLAAAIRDAKARAEQIASAGGQKVGALKAASSGVVQVLAPNSIEISDYGQYDTQSIEKEVMVTVRASFFVR